MMLKPIGFMRASPAGAPARTIDSVVVGAVSNGVIPITITSPDAQNGETVKWVLQNTGQTAPTDAQVDAGQAGAGATLLDSGSFSWSGSTFNDTLVNGIARQNADLYVIINNGQLSNVGADTNFLIDTTAPILSSPTGTQTGATTADGSVTSDEAQGTLYAGVWPTASTPSAADIRAGTGAIYHTSTGSPLAAVNNFAATGLTASTAYKWHFLQDDDFANASNGSTSAEFTTAAGGANPTATFLGHSALVNDPTVFTESGASLGAADSTRLIQVAIATWDQFNRTISSVTIGGVSASPVTGMGYVRTGQHGAAVYEAAVPTGTTGDIVVTFSGLVNRCQVVWSSVINGAIHASDFDQQAQTTDTSVAANVPANGSAVAFFTGDGLTGGTFAITGMTNAIDQSHTADLATGCAVDNGASAETPRTVTQTQNGGDSHMAALLTYEAA